MVLAFVTSGRFGRLVRGTCVFSDPSGKYNAVVIVFPRGERNINGSRQPEELSGRKADTESTNVFSCRSKDAADRGASAAAEKDKKEKDKSKKKEAKAKSKMMLMIRNGVASNDVKLYGTVDPPEAILEAAKSEGLMQQQQSQVGYLFFCRPPTEGHTTIDSWVSLLNHRALALLRSSLIYLRDIYQS